MLFALVSQTEIYNYFFNDKEYVIGRRNADFCITNDQSISRKHAVIKITNNSVAIFDCDSKYGTFVNDNKLGNEEITLKNGDLVKFGILQSVYRLNSYNLTTTCSGLNTIHKNLLRKKVESCGGQLLSNWTADCQFLTCDNIKLTIKLMQTLIDNKPVVNFDFWERSLDNIKAKKKLPNYEHFQPKYAEKSINVDNTVNLKNTNRHHLFNNKTFVFFDTKIQQQMQEIIEKIGGKTYCFETIDIEKIKKLIASQTSEYLFINDNCEKNFQVLKKFLTDNFEQRLILLQEIVLAILYGSCDKECNPNFNRITEVFSKHSDNGDNLATQLASQSVDIQSVSETAEHFPKEDIIIPPSYNDNDDVKIEINADNHHNFGDIAQSVDDNRDNFTMSVDNKTVTSDNQSRISDNRQNLHVTCHDISDNCNEKLSDGDHPRDICDNRPNLSNNSGDGLKKKPRNSDSDQKFVDNRSNLSGNCDEKQRGSYNRNTFSGNFKNIDDNHSNNSDNQLCKNINNYKRLTSNDNAPFKRIKIERDNDNTKNNDNLSIIDDNASKKRSVFNPFRRFKLESTNDNDRKRKNDNNEKIFAVPSTSKKSKTSMSSSLGKKEFGIDNGKNDNNNKNDNDNNRDGGKIKSEEKTFLLHTELDVDNSAISDLKFRIGNVLESARVSTFSSDNWLSKANVSNIAVKFQEDFDDNLREICGKFSNTINIKSFPLKIEEIIKKKWENSSFADNKENLGNKKKFRKIFPIRPQVRILRTESFKENQNCDQNNE